MAGLSLRLPALYGDHHVASVRHALDGLPGLSEIVINPATHTVVLEFDPSRQTAQEVERALASAGYVVGDIERAIPSVGPSAPRATAALGDTLTFIHQAPAWDGRPLWPCPGMDRTPPSET